MSDAAIFNRTNALGKAADFIFRTAGIDPALGSLAALELEIFDARLFPRQMLIRRVRAGITRQELADRAGYDLSVLRKWEIGRIPPKLPVMVDWAAALGCEVSLRLSPVTDSR